MWVENLFKFVYAEYSYQLNYSSKVETNDNDELGNFLLEDLQFNVNEAIDVCELLVKILIELDMYELWKAEIDIIDKNKNADHVFFSNFILWLWNKEYLENILLNIYICS